VKLIDIALIPISTSYSPEFHIGAMSFRRALNGPEALAMQSYFLSHNISTSTANITTNENPIRFDGLYNNGVSLGRPPLEPNSTGSSAYIDNEAPGVQNGSSPTQSISFPSDLQLFNGNKSWFMEFLLRVNTSTNSIPIITKMGANTSSSYIFVTLEGPYMKIYGGADYSATGSQAVCSLDFNRSSVFRMIFSYDPTRGFLLGVDMMLCSSVRIAATDLTHDLMIGAFPTDSWSYLNGGSLEIDSFSIFDHKFDSIEANSRYCTLWGTCPALPSPAPPVNCAKLTIPNSDMICKDGVWRASGLTLDQGMPHDLPLSLLAWVLILCFFLKISP